MKDSYNKYSGDRESIQGCSFTWHCSGQLTEASEDGLGSEDVEEDTEREEFSLMEASGKKKPGIFTSHHLQYFYFCELSEYLEI